MQEMDYSGKRDAEKLCMKRLRSSCTKACSALICKNFIQNFNSKLLIRIKRVIKCHSVINVTQVLLLGAAQKVVRVNSDLSNLFISL